MANLSAIFRESAKYLRERERDPRSARLSFEVMLIKLGYIIQQMRKGGGKTRAYIRNGASEVIARIRFIRAFTVFRFCLIPRLSIVRGAPRTDFAFVRNFYRASGIEIIDDTRLENMRCKKLVDSNYLFLLSNQIFISFAMYSINFRFNSFHFLEYLIIYELCVYKNTFLFPHNILIITDFQIFFVQS